ncbi:hypothetical protein PIB30_062297 [Stylosanthes scabra]|uniref:Protein BIG GRAIN 1-like B n=1 Tax=Stylosanthes scabra TaxID=79078 RepID=A0ABU6VKC1_9FABA|nr:hypothetical protein [Stylosanthes scabra]
MNTLTHHHSAHYPSFSSTLLDKIYRSIDEGQQTTDMNFYNNLTATKNVAAQTTTKAPHHHHHHHHQNSSSECTSSSSGGLSSSSSSSDTESFYAAVRSRASSCFPPSRPKPIRTTTTTSLDHGEEVLIKSKSRAFKIYNNLKKVKQPISPGGRLTTFLNSLFNTPTNSKKPTKPASSSIADRKAASSTCSSASSFSRSCLSKNSPSSRDNRLRNNNGVKRTVRFYPVSVILGEDTTPSAHKCLYQQGEAAAAAASMSVSVPTAWKIGRRSPSKQNEKQLKFPVMEKRNFYEDDDDDDAASDSSSDLFELDHLAVIGNHHHHHHHHHRYCEELPVYETTHVTTNRAVANDLLI